MFTGFSGGAGGIRTHVAVTPNGFQDRLVMTASIPLLVQHGFPYGTLVYINQRQISTQY